MIINFKTRQAARNFNAKRIAKGLPSSVGDRATMPSFASKPQSRYYVRLTA